MTALTEEQFASLCELLPAEVQWGDPLQPHVLNEILESHAAELRAEVERLRSNQRAMAALADERSRETFEARSDERTAMGYLAGVRQVVGGEDFPDMVRRVESLKHAESVLRIAALQLADTLGIADPTPGKIAAEVERLRADARRLDHLIASGAFRMISADMGGKHTWAGIGRPIGRGPTVRDAIDRAMEATNAG